MVNTKVIYGPPGTGKTRTLIGRAGDHLAAHKGRVLFCSHTRAAAKTAVERWAKPDPRLDISTLHSFCFREQAMSKAQTVDDDKLKEIVEDYGMDLDEGGQGRDYINMIALAASVGEAVEDIYDSSHRPGSRAHFLAFNESYIKWKNTNGYKDFQDMLEGYLKIKRGTGHSLLVVDEAQDLTPLHWRVIEHFMALNPECKVIIAGDDDQCIYSYAGAWPQGMEQFAIKRAAKEEVLSQSHRVPQQVWHVAQHIASRLTYSKRKTYQPRPEFGVVEEIHGIDQIFPDRDIDTLILYNDRFVRMEVEDWLKEQYIPYTATGGMPAPLDTRAAKAIRLAHKEGDLTDEERLTLKRSVNEKGAALYNSIGPEAVVERLRKGDYNLVNIIPSNMDYLHNVDYKAPINCRISTIHGAKGMEADDVFVINTQSEAAIRHSFKDPDAAHRLFYVAVTRAKERLTLCQGDNGYEFPVLVDG